MILCIYGSLYEKQVENGHPSLGFNKEIYINY